MFILIFTILPSSHPPFLPSFLSSPSSPSLLLYSHPSLTYTCSRLLIHNYFLIHQSTLSVKSFLFSISFPSTSTLLLLSFNSFLFLFYFPSPFSHYFHLFPAIPPLSSFFILVSLYHPSLSFTYHFTTLPHSHLHSIHSFFLSFPFFFFFSSPISSSFSSHFLYRASEV
jgi:hypothetical protein